MYYFKSLLQYVGSENVNRKRGDAEAARYCLPTLRVRKERERVCGFSFVEQNFCGFAILHAAHLYCAKFLIFNTFAKKITS